MIQSDYMYGDLPSYSEYGSLGQPGTAWGEWGGQLYGEEDLNRLWQGFGKVYGAEADASSGFLDDAIAGALGGQYRDTSLYQQEKYLRDQYRQDYIDYNKSREAFTTQAEVDARIASRRQGKSGFESGGSQAKNIENIKRSHTADMANLGLGLEAQKTQYTKDIYGIRKNYADTLWSNYTAFISQVEDPFMTNPMWERFGERYEAYRPGDDLGGQLDWDYVMYGA